MSVPTKRQARQLEIDGFEPVAVTCSNGATRITKSYDGWSCTTIVQPGSIAVFPDNLDECLRWAAAILYIEPLRVLLKIFFVLVS